MHREEAPAPEQSAGGMQVAIVHVVPDSHPQATRARRGEENDTPGLADACPGRAPRAVAQAVDAGHQPVPEAAAGLGQDDQIGSLVPDDVGEPPGVPGAR
jgi:hypothetical protein